MTAVQKIRLAQDWAMACIDTDGTLNQGMLDDAFEMVPRKLGVDLTIAQHEKLDQMVERMILPDLIWSRLGNIPINDDGEIEEAFLHFPVGTNRETIWKWMERSYSDFSVAKAMGVA